MSQTIAVVGAGYVGLVTAIAFAEQGHRVVCVDVDANRVKAVNEGRAPFFENGLDEALGSVVKAKRLTATADGPAAVAASAFSFLCVGTPARRDGSMDDTQLLAAARTVGEGLRRGKDGHVVVVKSTVRPGGTESVVAPAIRAGLGGDAPAFGLCVNPEFLREGSALVDARSPDRIVIGEQDRASGDSLAALYAGSTCPTLRTDLRTAEMIKYATNAFLATKVSFANELANLCDRFGVDSDVVVRGMGMDPRINPRHMVPGVGFGGSCFPKDVAALVVAGKAEGYDAALLSAVLALNDRQPLRAIDLLENELGALAGKRIAILGLAFKAGTDDVRESRAIPLARTLLDRGATVAGYDPVAGSHFANVVPEVTLAKTVADALRGADGCVIQADWPEFRTMRAKDFDGMTNRVVVDGRRTLDGETLGGRVVYRRIG